jgi:hypothetical protein
MRFETSNDHGSLTIATEIFGRHFRKFQIPLIQLLSHPIVKQPQACGQIQIATINGRLCDPGQFSTKIAQQRILGRGHILVEFSLHAPGGQVQQDSWKFDDFVAFELYLRFSGPTGRFEVHNNEMSEDRQRCGRLLINLFAHYCRVWRLILHFDGVDEIQSSGRGKKGLLRFKLIFIRILCLLG